MKAIRDLISVIRDSVEVEIQMTNQFVLMGDKFYVDLQALNFEPEAQPPPPAPIEQNCKIWGIFEKAFLTFE